MLRLDHLTILVGSIEGSRSFYETLLPLLGFSRTTRENWTDGKGFFFQFRAANAGTRPYERHGAGLNHMGFGARDQHLGLDHARATFDAMGQVMQFGQIALLVQRRQHGAILFKAGKQRR